MSPTHHPHNKPWVVDYIRKLRRATKPSPYTENFIHIEGRLRESKFPDKLYRYREISDRECKTIIGEYSFEQRRWNSQIWISHPSKFSDPDCLASIPSEIRYKWNIIRAIRNYGCRIWGYDRFKIPFDVCSSSDINNLLCQVNTLFSNVVIDDKNSTNFEETYNEQIIHFSIEREKECPFLETVRKQLFFKLGICCFATSFNSTKLWKKNSNHNIDNDLENGMCIEYNRNEIPINILQYLYPVYYSEEGQFPDITPIILNNLTDFEKAYDFLALEIILTKNAEFDFEKEWRLVIPLKVDDNVGYISPFPKPSAIYLGSDVSDEKRENVRKIAERCRIHLIQLKKISDNNYVKEDIYVPSGD